MVTPDDALNFYKGPPTEAEDALITVFETTNKGIAHSTNDFNAHPEHARLAEIASRGIPFVVHSEKGW
jgi:hypothetical protein